MKYFTSLIPKITLNDDIFYDMFFNLDIQNVIKQEFLIQHQLLEGELLQDVAYTYYKDPQLWWLIALTNDIKDPFFDIANDNEYVQKISVDIATEQGLFWDPDDESLFWDPNDESLFWYATDESFIETYDEQTKLNELKREINVIKPAHLSSVINQILNEVTND